MSRFMKGICIANFAWLFGNSMHCLFVRNNVVGEMLYFLASAFWLGMAYREEDK